MTSSSTEIRERRKFGIIAFVFFGFLCFLGLRTGKAIPFCLFGFLSLLGLGFILLPGPMGPIHRGWLRIAHRVGRAITSIVLILAYYLVMTPSAVVKRVFGGRPLPVRPDKNATTYWVARNENAQPKERFLKRF